MQTNPNPSTQAGLQDPAAFFGDHLSGLATLLYCHILKCRSYTQASFIKLLRKPASTKKCLVMCLHFTGFCNLLSYRILRWYLFFFVLPALLYFSLLGQFDRPDAPEGSKEKSFPGRDREPRLVAGGRPLPGHQV